MRTDINPTGTYLRTIYELEEAGIEPRRVRISERLTQTAATVGQAIGRMTRDGLILAGSDRRLELTDIGLARAVTVVRKQRLAECLLVPIIGLDPELARAESCLWQHVISDAVESKLVQLLGHPTVTPGRLAIPGLQQLQHPAGAYESSTHIQDPTVERLDEFARHGGGAAEVCYIGTHSLPDPVLRARLNSIGIQIGTTITISAASRRDRPVSVHTTRSSTKLPTALAQAVHVRAHPRQSSV